jgi:putative DNA primase/helicase
MNESIKYNQDIKFDFDILNAIKKEAELIKDKSIKHSEILNFLLDQIKEVDFRELAELKAEKDNLGKKHFLICSIEQILETAQINNWGICKYLSFVYLYNGAYWRLFDNSELQEFLGKASEKMGVDKFDARHYQFREQLYKQFLAVANLPKPNQEYDTVLINLKNGTFEISPHKQFLRPSKKEDFLTYQLPFEYNPDAKAPIFCEYLNKVQPDIKRQNILAEYLAYIFIKTSFLKLEKTLLLYGSGANGKSVFFEIVNAMLGSENISCFSLQNLTNENGYYRAMLSNKLLNYSSEINGKLETSIFSFGYAIFDSNNCPVKLNISISHDLSKLDLAFTMIRKLSDLMSEPDKFPWIQEKIKKIVAKKFPTFIRSQCNDYTNLYNSYY